MLKLRHIAVSRPFLAIALTTVMAGMWGGSQARGEVVTVTETGTVTSLTDALGAFGTRGSNLAGDVITNVYTFDLGVIPPISESLGGNNSLQLLLAEGGLLSSVTTTIDGQPISIYGNSSFSDFSLQPNPVTGDYPSGSLLALTAYGFDQPFNPLGLTGNLVFLNDQLYSLQSPILPSLTDPSYLQVNNPSGDVFGSGEIDITGYAFDPAGGARYTGGAEFGTFSASSIEVDVSDGVQITSNDPPPIIPVPSAVPEPTTWMLLLMGVFGLGAMLRAKRAGALGPIARELRLS